MAASAGARSYAAIITGSGNTGTPVPAGRSRANSTVPDIMQVSNPLCHVSSGVFSTAPHGPTALQKLRVALPFLSFYRPI